MTEEKQLIATELSIQQRARIQKKYAALAKVCNIKHIVCSHHANTQLRDIEDYETSDGDSARRSLEDVRRRPRLDLSQDKSP